MKSVKNQSKQKYTPCELKVLEFTVEHEFGGGNTSIPSGLTITTKTQQNQVVGFTATMSKRSNGFYDPDNQYGTGVSIDDGFGKQK